MKVLLINGSPHVEGCTYTALREVADQIELAGIETELMHVGVMPVNGCTGCGFCTKHQRNMCVFMKDPVNDALEKSKEADGIVIGSPVHYAGPSGMAKSFFDRFFHAGLYFRNKPGAAIVSCRRGGATTALDQLNKYFMIKEMNLVASQYWNMVHGHTPDEVRQDLEGMQTMRVLGRNLAWLLKSIDAGRAAGIPSPETEPREKTNFIR
jgi:multimeric flavodoxin WrbA